MQCTSFLQGCSSSRDVNAGANNGAWLYNGNTSLTTGHLYNVSLPPPSTDLFVVNDKDLLRQTMLRHDIIFRDQVRELHRLYRRQRELMDEFKMRELSKQKLQLQAPHSNSFLPEISSKSAQCTWQTPGLPWVRLAACKLSTSSSENFQSVSSKWSSSQAGPCTAQDEDGLKEDLKLSGPKLEKPRRKMLDLELPPDEYINSEEEDHPGDGKLSKVPELPYYPPERMPGILLKKDLKPFPCDVLVNSSSQGGRDTSHKGIQCQDQEMSRLSNLGFQVLSKEIVSSVQSKTIVEACIKSACSSRNMTGLGAGVYPLATGFFSGNQSRTDACFPLVGSNHLNPSSAIGSSGRNLSFVTMDLNVPPICLLGSEVYPENFGTEDGKLEESQVAFYGPSEKIDRTSKPNRGREDSSQADLVFSQVFPISASGVEPKMLTATDYVVKENILGSSNHKKPHVSPDQVVPVESASIDSHPYASEDGGIESNQKTGLPQAKLARHPFSNNMSLEAMVDGNLSRVQKQIDLNSSIQEEKSSPNLSIQRLNTKAVAEIDLEAPVSPENKECSPPRGESENQIEMPIDLSKKEDRTSKDELVSGAAETLVLISTTRFQNLLTENNICETLEGSLADSLQWLAGVISSTADGLGSEVRMSLSSEDAGDQHELSSDGSDYFDTMTVELTEMKVKEYCSKNSGQEEEGTAANASERLPRRVHIKRGRQRKDFQTEVLPSLASLSRHEVTKDLQTIGGLMEGAGSPAETSSGRRNVARNGGSRARRRTTNSFRHSIEKAELSLLKQENNDGKLALGEGRLEGWGKMNRRPRGPRIPAIINPPVIYSGDCVVGE
ncbi:uncharacterized protein LOC127790381 isoform X2 [Diospyros lotus]|uniref:uncharacterized protein LOC127790381 isoform X2 n=1 Tax=Diospyros lotus TaxID=55363 RepID=UPI00224C8F54|nr:uncharacterized protein LOC127790381 isoform X2 [Diospyros lotus]